ncbi:MAG: TonB family C-terminal domain-containing protein [Gammaproteobacteria bacterium]|nr:MAG: TonB family C-terminal domain-containing protein [Gammaproteobacteria bacterium]TND06398.1 MAG: TonB family C-terminal domain-containing protein [Gammaproteobacteria bacterium]
MTTAESYHSLHLPWTLGADDERRFRNILWVVLLLCIAISAVVPWINVPEIAREEAEALPSRLAKLVIEKKEEPPPPEIKKEEEKKPEEKKPEDKVEKATEKAREKAQKSGLVALRSELAELRKNPALDSLKKDTALLLSGQQMLTNQRSIITSNVARGSGGVQGAAINRNIGVQSLASISTTQVESPIGVDDVKVANDDPKKPRRKTRSLEEIQLVLEQNKGALFSLYHRALRSDPSLQGKVVLELTVAPNGVILDCKVISSDVRDDDFLRKLVARVKLFDFGTKDVEEMIVTYPIDFLPTSG